MKLPTLNHLFCAILIGLLPIFAAETGATSTSDTATYKDLEQQLKVAEGKVAILKADDKKASDKMKDEDRVSALKEINEALQAVERNVGSAETAKSLTAPHAKQLKRRIQEVKTFLTAYNKKHPPKTDDAKSDDSDKAPPQAAPGS
ncbi:MAG: hypothetical protein HY360_24960 [Verrucomicrobia bacterium]|nr:hypothetical protein [Verrucomicrobiota bacterium]